MDTTHLAFTSYGATVFFLYPAIEQHDGKEGKQKTAPHMIDQGTVGCGGKTYASDQF